MQVIQEWHIKVDNWLAWLKTGATILFPVTSSNVDYFQLSLTIRLSSKFLIKSSVKIQLHLKSVLLRPNSITLSWRSWSQTGS